MMQSLHQQMGRLFPLTLGQLGMCWTPSLHQSCPSYLKNPQRNSHPQGFMSFPNEYKVFANSSTCITYPLCRGINAREASSKAEEKKTQEQAKEHNQGTTLHQKCCKRQAQDNYPLKDGTWPPNNCISANTYQNQHLLAEGFLFGRSACSEPSAPEVLYSNSRKDVWEENSRPACFVLSSPLLIWIYSSPL